MVSRTSSKELSASSSDSSKLKKEFWSQCHILLFWTHTFGIWCYWYLVLLVFGLIGIWSCWYSILLVFGRIGIWSYWYLVLLVFGLIGICSYWYLVLLLFNRLRACRRAKVLGQQIAIMLDRGLRALVKIKLTNYSNTLKTQCRQCLISFRIDVGNIENTREIHPKIINKKRSKS